MTYLSREKPTLWHLEAFEGLLRDDGLVSQDASLLSRNANLVFLLSRNSCFYYRETRILANLVSLITRDSCLVSRDAKVVLRGTKILLSNAVRFTVSIIVP